MSLEVTCKVCGEEFDMRHGLCPACRWRVKRVAQLETINADLLEACKYTLRMLTAIKRTEICIGANKVAREKLGKAIRKATA